MDRISTETELNWEFVEPLNGNALNGLEERLKIGFSDAFKDFIQLARKTPSFRAEM